MKAKITEYKEKGVLYDTTQAFNILVRKVREGENIKAGDLVSKENNLITSEKKEVFGIALTSTSKRDEHVAILVRGILRKGIVKKEKELLLEKIGIYIE